MNGNGCGNVSTVVGKKGFGVKDAWEEKTPNPKSVGICVRRVLVTK